MDAKCDLNTLNLCTKLPKKRIRNKSGECDWRKSFRVTLGYIGNSVLGQPEQLKNLL